MAKALILEKFDHASPKKPAEKALFSEEARLEAFEQGYKAGWDDCVSSSNDDAGRISADFAANLKDLSFTFHEARAHVLQGIEPILVEMAQKVLPELAGQTLPLKIVDILRECMSEAAEQPMVITVAPASRTAIEAVIPNDAGFPIKVVEEDTLAEGQVFIRGSTGEQSVDLANTLREVEALVTGFFNENERQVAYG